LVGIEEGITSEDKLAQCLISLKKTVDPSEGPWFEVPWWIWSEDDLQRRRVFCKYEYARCPHIRLTWKRYESSFRFTRHATLKMG
jgi:hypothetical protein